MTWRVYLALSVLGCVLAAGVASLQAWPGYMDADYYFVTGLQLAQGKGFNEPFLWNYLDDPAGLPHPAFGYWMPLAGLLSALGLAAARSASFAAARVGFILLAACVPPATAALAHDLTGKRRSAILAGLLAAFPGFYLPYLTTTDTFGLYMLLGIACLQLFKKVRAAGGRDRMGGQLSTLAWAFSLGIVTGLMHLARADGTLWLGLGGLALSFLPVNTNGITGMRSTRARLAARGLLVFGLAAGYLLVMSPWLARNLELYGSPLAPGGGRALWLLDFDELYLYPPIQLTPARWWSAGVGDLLRARLWAAGLNLQTALAVQGEIFLLPLAAAGMWLHRVDTRVRLGAAAWGLTLLVMTLVFPFQGARGGFFHSGAALQPLLWALAPAGLESLVAWGERRRGWQPRHALPIMGAGMVFLAALLTALTATPHLLGGTQGFPAWGSGEAAYTRLEAALLEAGVEAGARVLVNNPPGYFSASGRPALVIPDGGEQAALEVAGHYEGRYLLLEANHPRGLESLYRDPGDRPGLRFLFTFEGTHVFALEPGEGEVGGR